MSVVKDYTERARLFRALAHPARLQILDILRRDDECVCHMEAELGRRQAYISQQLMILRDAGLVDSRKEGLNVFYRLADPAAIAPLLEAALGPLARKGRHLPGGCPCPKCAVASVPKSRTQEREPC